MKCRIDRFITKNKKSFSNHMRWHKGLMDKASYKGINLAEKNGNWVGNTIRSMPNLHIWVRGRLKEPSVCPKCNEQKKKLDLANKNGLYTRDLNNWNYLCRSCHMKEDGRLEALHSKEKRKKAGETYRRRSYANL